jgi:hypothetical protein
MERESIEKYYDDKNVIVSLRVICILFIVLVLMACLNLLQKFWIRIRQLYKNHYLRKDIKEFSPSTVQRQQQQAMIMITVLTVMFLIWPLFFDALVGFYKMRYSFATVIGFIWTFVLQLWDILYWIRPRPMETLAKRFEDGSLQADAQSIVTIAFAMGTLLFREPPETLCTSIKVSVPPIKLGLLLALSFLIPNPMANDRTIFGFALRALQKSLLNFSLGFIVTGIAADLNLRL